MCIIHKVNLVAVVLLLVLATPIPVSARDTPKTTFPLDGSTVTGEIQVVRVEFSEAIDPTMSGLELRKGGTQVWIAGVGAGFCDASSCQLPLGQLEPDNYTVTFDVLTPPGKVMKDQFTFIVGGTN